MKTIIGLSGWARSGKDTVADVLVSMQGFTRIAFADPLRDFLVAQDATVRMDGLNEYWPVSRIIEKYGWQGYKTSPFAGNMRTLIMRTGTEAGRNQIHQNVWVDAAIRRAQGHERVVFSDVRFINEAEAVKAIGGEIWRIDRPGIGPGSDHSSETEMNDYPFDLRIDNDSDLESLANQVAHFLVD